MVFNNDGSRGWSAELRHDDRYLSQAGTVVGDDLVFTNEGGEVRALDVDSGELRWRQDLHGPLSAAWVAGGLMVVVVDQVSEQARTTVFGR